MDDIKKCPLCGNVAQSRVMRTGEDCGTCAFQGKEITCSACVWFDDGRKSAYERR